MRANIYIDGFNLYYRALKGTPYRWLDLVRQPPLGLLAIGGCRTRGPEPQTSAKL
jgi:hypothetical protein